MIAQIRCRASDPFRAASRGSQPPQSTRPPSPLLDYSNIAEEKSSQFFGSLNRTEGYRRVFESGGLLSDVKEWHRRFSPGDRAGG
jgi:hypothetical protein